MLKIYPAVFHNESESYWVDFPDLSGCHSYGDNLEDAMANAQEAMGLYLVALLESEKPLPSASDINSIKLTDNDSAKSYVSVEIDKYRRSNKAVRKTLSLPEWLAEEAEKRNISLSKVLQDGLKAMIY